MTEETGAASNSRLSGEDLTFWWADSPMQPTTMAMLMLLDRKPDPVRLKQAFGRAVHAVPRLAERVAEAPLDLTLPHWQRDPTFDVDYHVRHHALSGHHNLEELFREIAPTYETPFDRSRPLWEARVFDALHGRAKAAIFFKLHHAVADGVGGNAIFAAMTDWERDPGGDASASGHVHSKGGWPESPWFAERVVDALRDRVALEMEHARSVASTVADIVQHPDKLSRAREAIVSIVETARFDSHSPLRGYGRARHLTGCELPFPAMRDLRRHLGGSMIDVILTIMARAMGKWHVSRGLAQVKELMTLVPVNLRKPEEWADKPHLGNVATGILVPLPIRLRDSLTTYREVHKRMEAKKNDPASQAAPMLAEMMSLLPRSFFTWMSEATFGNIDFIVTNIPGIMVPRYMAGAEIVAAYPFAPVAVRSPVSVALYGYRDHLFIGLNSDETTMPDVEDFKQMILEAFKELQAAAQRGAAGGRVSGRGRRRTTKPSE
jgi:WS/DGAT/MGAT family acyltransferase